MIQGSCSGWVFWNTQVPHWLVCPVLARFGSAKCGASMLCVLGMILQLLGFTYLASQPTSGKLYLSYFPSKFSASIISMNAQGQICCRHTYCLLLPEAPGATAHSLSCTASMCSTAEASFPWGKCSESFAECSFQAFLPASHGRRLVSVCMFSHIIYHEG